MTKPLRRAVILVAASAATGWIVVAIARGLAGHDPAAKLASALGLGSGVILGAVLGGILGGWLVIGGRRRVARTAGFLLGVAFIYGAWLGTRSNLWVLDVVMHEIFGEGGEQYSALVLFLIAIPLFRTVAGVGTGLVGSLLLARRL